MKTFWHLVKRFFGSLKQKTVSEEDLLWVENILSQEEMHLWQTMPENDKCHSIEVARRTGTLLGKLEPEVLAAALLHDVGKADAPLAAIAQQTLELILILGGGDDQYFPDPRQH